MRPATIGPLFVEAGVVHRGRDICEVNHKVLCGSYEIAAVPPSNSYSGGKILAT